MPMVFTLFSNMHQHTEAVFDTSYVRYLTLLNHRKNVSFLQRKKASKPPTPLVVTGQHLHFQKAGTELHRGGDCVCVCILLDCVCVHPFVFSWDTPENKHLLCTKTVLKYGYTLLIFVTATCQHLLQKCAISVKSLRKDSCYCFSQACVWQSNWDTF